MARNHHNCARRTPGTTRSLRRNSLLDTSSRDPLATPHNILDWMDGLRGIAGIPADFGAYGNDSGIPMKSPSAGLPSPGER